MHIPDPEKPETKKVIVELETPVVEEFDAIAKRVKRTRSALLRFVIDHFLEGQRVQQAGSTK